jgi:hypothetical protein
MVPEKRKIPTMNIHPAHRSKVDRRKCGLSNAINIKPSEW